MGGQPGSDATGRITTVRTFATAALFATLPLVALASAHAVAAPLEGTSRHSLDATAAQSVSLPPQELAQARRFTRDMPSHLHDSVLRAYLCSVVHTDAGWSSSVARWAHNPEVAGSNPVPATTNGPEYTTPGRFACAGSRHRQAQRVAPAGAVPIDQRGECSGHRIEAGRPHGDAPRLRRIPCELTTHVGDPDSHRAIPLPRNAAYRDAGEMFVRFASPLSRSSQ